MPLLDGQSHIYYYSSRCKAAWLAFQDRQDNWGNDPKQHQWWTTGLRLEGVSSLSICKLNLLPDGKTQDRLAKSIGYHVAFGFIVKVPSWVKFFIRSTHPQEREFASLPPFNLLLDTTYTDDPSRVVASYHADWWNSPGGACTLPPADSEDETVAFNDWLKLANLVGTINHYLHSSDDV